MEEKIKQRLIGVLVFIGALFIVLPFLFHNPQPLAQKNLSTNIPNPPTAQSVTLDLPAIKTNVAQQASTPVITAPVVAALNAAPDATPTPTTTKPAVAAADTTPTTEKPAVAAINATPTVTPAAAKPVMAEANVATTTAAATPASTPAAASTVTPPPAVSAAASTVIKPRVASTALAQNPEAWTIQLGVFSSRENAKDFMMKLRKQHFEAYTRTVMHDKNKLTAIYVGPEINKQKIQITQNNLEKKFHIKGVVRKYQL